MGQVINFTVIMCTWASYEIRTFYLHVYKHMFVYILIDTDCIQHHNKYMYAYPDDED